MGLRAQLLPLMMNEQMGARTITIDGSERATSGNLDEAEVTGVTKGETEILATTSDVRRAIWEEGSTCAYHFREPTRIGTN